jgi:hypothetical protein
MIPPDLMAIRARGLITLPTGLFNENLPFASFPANDLVGWTAAVRLRPAGRLSWVESCH